MVPPSLARRSIPLCTAVLLAAAADPAAAQTRYELVPAETRVSFDASATMGRFSGRAQRVSGWVDVGDAETLAGTRGEVSVDAGSFGTGIALRNRHLRDEMEVERYPWIRFVLERVTPSGGAAEGGRAVTLHGRLTIKAATREVEIPATVTQSDGTLTVDGQLPAKFTEYGMRPPTRMGGMTRVRDELTLRFHVVFRRAGS
ncbi:MAG TPA: YceI family protein [Longimicrobium sp.]|jgi:polyisoprenoid-binding protein YceI